LNEAMAEVKRRSAARDLKQIKVFSNDRPENR
jgi:hypothetical protein